MCDNPISKKIEVKSETKEEIPASNMNVEYKGKTTGMATSLKSRPKSTIEVKGNLKFETVGDICDKTDYLESKAIFSIEHLMLGPLDTFGSKLTFDNMYFHFKDLKMNLIVRFYYNSLTICRESPETNEKRDYSIKYEIDKEPGLDLKLFYATNGKTNDINSLFYDLEEDFKSYNSGFAKFYDYLLDQLDGSFQFSKQIEDEFKKVYCEQAQEQAKEQTEEKAIKNTYILYKQKIDILKKLDVYPVIYSSKI